MTDQQPLSDPGALLYAACEHIRQGGVPEVELEWWEDTQGGERRLTVTVRGRDYFEEIRQSAAAQRADVARLRMLGRDIAIPNTPEGLEEP